MYKNVTFPQTSLHLHRKKLSCKTDMKKPNILQDEETRLKALRSLDILDSPTEERFDRIARMAKRIFDVPIVLVGFIDKDRHWFKSRIGLNLDEEPRETSFCNHSILCDEAFIVSDATLDERFANNPLVTGEPNIRFYAGYPLKLNDGSKIGTFCIIDKKPRHLNSDDIATLSDLAMLIEREIAAIQLSTIDEMTGILNRRGFLALGQQSIEFCTQQNIPTILTYMRLNKLEQINNTSRRTFGHTRGNAILASFSNLLNSQCRSSDLIARVSDNEFVMLSVYADNNSVKSTTKRIQMSLDHKEQNSNDEDNISFSHAAVNFDPSQHDSIDALLEDGKLQMG